MKPNNTKKSNGWSNSDVNNKGLKKKLKKCIEKSEHKLKTAEYTRNNATQSASSGLYTNVGKHSPKSANETNNINMNKRRADTKNGSNKKSKTSKLQDGLTIQDKPLKQSQLKKKCKDIGSLSNDQSRHKKPPSGNVKNNKMKKNMASENKKPTPAGNSTPKPKAKTNVSLKRSDSSQFHQDEFTDSSYEYSTDYSESYDSLDNDSFLSSDSSRSHPHDVFGDFGIGNNEENSCSGDDTYSFDSSSFDSSESESDIYNMFGDYDSKSNDQETKSNSLEDLRVAPGTAICHNISGDQYAELFEDNEKLSIANIPGKESLFQCYDLSPNAEAIKKDYQVKLKEEEERKLREFEEATRKYFTMDKIKGDNLELTMNPTIISCQSDSLLDITIPLHVSTKSTSREYPRIFLSKGNRSIISTAGSPQTFGDKVIRKKDNRRKEKAIVCDNINDDEIEKSIPFIASAAATTTANMKAKPNQKPKFFNSINSRHVLLLLKSKLYFNGNLQVTLIGGNAKVFGYELIHNKTTAVHSHYSEGQPFQSIEPSSISNSSGQKENSAFSKRLEKFDDGFLAQDMDYIRENFNAEFDALILLERDQTNNGVHMAERYMREAIVPNINIFNSDSHFYNSEFILQCQFSYRPRKGLVINTEWDNIFINSSSKVFVVGGKDAGKSTCIRYLINSHLNTHKRFLLIDLDIGQPEIFLPQTISATIISEPILGPGFLENVKPLKAILFGDVNVLPSPIKYLKCVMELFSFCSNNVNGLTSGMPWIVNTMGYTRGLGMELISSILRIFNPTDLVQIQKPFPRDNFDKVLTDSVVNNMPLELFKAEIEQFDLCQYTTHVCRSISQGKDTVSMAKDTRYATILSKLGNVLNSNSDWLSTVRPFSASLNDLSIIVPGDEDISPENYPELLNSSLVYLCNKKDNVDTPVECFGIGMVRAVDKLLGKVYLLSSITAEELVNVNSLALCAIPLPSAVLLNQHSLVRGAVPFVYNSDGFVGSKQIAQHVYKPERSHRT